MGHPADIRLVDAHAKRDGGNDNIPLPGHEGFLYPVAFVILEPRMICLCRQPLRLQEPGYLFGGFLQGDINNGRL